MRFVYRNREFVECRDLLLKRAEELSIRKADGRIWRQVQACPLAFVPYLTGPDEDVHMTYSQFINEALGASETFNANPRRLTELLKYLEGCRTAPRLLDFEPARDLLSFSNGVLALSTGEFVPYGGDLSRFGGRAARHHIHQPWTGDTRTPLLDKILDHQFDRDVADLLLALLGRCFFRVGQLDDWQVFPYIKGTGGTGKSVVLNVLTALFREGTVRNLATKRGGVFGGDNIADKDLVLARDVPKKLSGVLPQETLQSMVSGEVLRVAGKGGKAGNIRWTAPVVVTSNHFPDYESTGGNTSRRFATFCFDNPVANPDYSLQGRILQQELPNVVARSLRCYLELRQRIRDEGTSFWSAVPPQVLAWKSSVSKQTSSSPLQWQRLRMGQGI
jgi:phage/plasmid-associated DNA primase